VPVLKVGKGEWEQWRERGKSPKYMRSIWDPIY